MAVPVVPLTPTIATATAEAAKATADRMTADVVVARGKDTWTIPGTSLVPLISFSTAADGSITPVLDQAGLDPMLKALAPKVKQDVRDASLKMVNGHVVATGTSREGRTLKIPETKAAIVSEIGARQAGAAATPVEAVVKAVDPKLTTADAKAFAPNMKVISSYSVYYWVIVNNHWGGNIEGPATVINGTVVPAGTKFDFWKVVGDLHEHPARARATRSRAGRSPSPARSAAASAPRPRRCSTRRSGQAWCRSPDRTTTSSSPGIRRASMPPCGRSAIPSRP